MPIKIGITGGIGSGKSVVSRLMEIMGIPVYISDQKSKRLTATDAFIREELIKLVGKEVFKDGNLNKPLLASYIFNDDTCREKVNNIIHPRVRADFQEWVFRNDACEFVAMESAILIESGFKNEVDVVVMVYAPLNLRVERTIKRDFSDKETILKRIRSQMDDEQKKEHADYIVCNDDVTPLIPQLIRMMERLKEG